MSALEQAFVDLALDGEQAKLHHLMQAGADVDSKDSHGKTALQLLAEKVSECSDRMKILVDMGARVNQQVNDHVTKAITVLSEIISSGEIHTPSESEYADDSFSTVMETAVWYDTLVCLGWFLIDLID